MDPRRHQLSADLGERRIAPTRRQGIARIGVLICVAAAAVVGALSLDDALGALDDRAEENAARSYLDRVFGDDGSIVGSRSVVEDARTRIPDNETYRIVMGPANGRFNPDVAPDFLRYFLLPRRESEDARWVLCLGCKRSSLGEAFETLSRENGIAFGRLRG